MAKPLIKSDSTLWRTLWSFAQHIVDEVKQHCIAFFPQRLPDLPTVGLVVDCTVVPVARPAGPMMMGTCFFSGKHKQYVMKMEVGCNPVTGMASTVSKAYTGSVRDYNVFKDHYPSFQQELHGDIILADSAYKAAATTVGAMITHPRLTPELSAKRVQVERFFGRMKTVDVVSKSVPIEKGQI